MHNHRANSPPQQPILQASAHAAPRLPRVSETRIEDAAARNAAAVVMRELADEANASPDGVAADAGTGFNPNAKGKVAPQDSQPLMSIHTDDPTAVTSDAVDWFSPDVAAQCLRESDVLAGAWDAAKNRLQEMAMRGALAAFPTYDSAMLKVPGSNRSYTRV